MIFATEPGPYGSYSEGYPALLHEAPRRLRLVTNPRKSVRHHVTNGHVPARDLPLAPDDPRHGTPGGYTNHGCRLPCCTEARRQVAAAGRARRRAAAVDRVRAL